MRLFVLLLICLLTASVYGGATFDNLGEFKVGVRSQVREGGTTIISDSVLEEFCSRAIVWTSTDIGGVEATYLVETVTGQSFYALPDSIVQIFQATLISNGHTFSIKAMPPEVTEDLFSSTMGDSSDVHGGPKAYSWWADTLQLIPAGVDASDSIYLKCFIEHRELAGKDDTADIHLAASYQEAALWYASFLIEDRLNDREKAQWYMTLYDWAVAKLRAAHARKIDPLPREK